MNNTTDNNAITTTQAKKRHGRLYRLSGNLLICKTTSRVIPHNFVDCSRNRVHEFTAGSAQRMRRYLRECLADYAYMVTLTYPGFFESDGNLVKEHLRKFMQECRRKIDRENPGIRLQYSSFWFLEFQERGAPHFHIFTTHYFDKYWVSRTWYRIVNSEDPRHLAAGTRCETLKRGRAGLISYAQKYANKQCQKVVPENYENVGRFWGVSGYRATVSADTFVSQHDSKDQSIRHSENSLVNAVNKGISDGQITIYKRDNGVSIHILIGNQIWRRLMLKMSILAAKTMKVPQLFQDADLDIERE